MIFPGFELKNSCNHDARCSTAIINNLSGYYTCDLGLRTRTETFFKISESSRGGKRNGRRSVVSATNEGHSSPSHKACWIFHLIKLRLAFLLNRSTGGMDLIGAPFEFRKANLNPGFPARNAGSSVLRLCQDRFDGANSAIFQKFSAPYCGSKPSKVDWERTFEAMARRNSSRRQGGFTSRHERKPEALFRPARV